MGRSARILTSPLFSLLFAFFFFYFFVLFSSEFLTSVLFPCAMTVLPACTELCTLYCIYTAIESYMDTPPFVYVRSILTITVEHVSVVRIRNLLVHVGLLKSTENL